MTKRGPGIIAALAAAAVLQMASAGAAPPGAQACRPADAPAYFRASLAVPGGADPGSRARQKEGDRIPEPGDWATLFAGLLGAVSIIRRRMS